MADININLANGDKAGETLKQLTHQAAALKKELGGLKPGTDEFVKSAQSLNQVDSKLGDIRTQIKGTTAASDDLKKTFGGILGQIPGFNALSGALGTAKGGVGGLSSSFGVLKGAIAATGIGLLIIVLGGLFNWMSKVEGITNIVKGAWEGLTAAFKTFINAVANWDFSNLGDKMAKAAEEGYNLVQVFDELEDKARSIDLANEQSGKLVDSLLLQSKNVSLSFKERLNLLEQASIVETFQHQRRLRYALEYQTAVQREVDNAERQGQMNDDLADKLVAAKKAVIAVEREDLLLQDKIEKRRAAMLEKQEAQNEKAAAQREKQREKELKALDKFIEEYEARELKLENHLNDRMINAAKKEEQRIQDSMKAMALHLAKKIELSEQEIEQIERLNQIEAASERERNALMNEGVNALVNALSVDEAARKKNAQAIKVFTSGQIATNLMAEIQAIWANANASPTNILFPGSGALIAGAKTLFATARAGVALTRVNAQQFETGGEILGPRHSNGGVMINAEGGEFMFSRKATAAFGVQNLAAMNNRYTFETGGPVDPFDKSRMPVSSGNAGSDPFSAITDLKNAFLSYAEATDKRFDRIKVTNNLSEARDGLRTLNTLEDEANV